MRFLFFCERVNWSLLGVEYLISVLRNHGHEVIMFVDPLFSTGWVDYSVETDQDGAIVEDILAKRPDAILSYIHTSNFQRVGAVFKAVKDRAPHIWTCVGGPHATYSHETTVQKPGFDYVCRGEGEIALLELIDLVEGKRDTLPEGIYRRRDGVMEGKGLGTLVANMDDLPFPDKSEYYRHMPHSRTVYTIMSGRGCYNRCTFCNSNTIRNHYREDGFNFMRRRSVDDIIAELSQAKAACSPKFVWFCDDTFIYNKKWLMEFAEKYKAAINLPFGCSTIPDFFDEAVLDALADAGLSNVQVGIQTLNPETRARIFGRRETNDQFREFVRLLKKRGVYLNTDHIISPWDSRDSMLEQARIYNDIRPSYINVYHLLYFPDTRVVDHALRDGFITPEAASKIGEGVTTTFYTGGSVKEYIDGCQDLANLLKTIPMLPKGLVAWLLENNRVRIFKFIPRSAILGIRALVALLNPSDASGRTQMRNMLSYVSHGWFNSREEKRCAALLRNAMSKQVQLKPAIPLEAANRKALEPINILDR
jgi:anaerobic magnesium-protoporphyrin IX monomethyl ester cyclase